MTEPRYRFFKLLNRRAKDEQLIVNYAHHRAHNFILDQGVLGTEVE